LRVRHIFFAFLAVSAAAWRAIDIGHGYTADGGATFPFRGKGVGLMPSLSEMLAAFPGRAFLINV
jgi:glycerophosphoryl diester phosphodiesterase